MNPTEWRCRPVVELDATADKCLFFWDEAMKLRACGHVDGDPACLMTRYASGDDDAASEVQMALFGQVVACPDCGSVSACTHDEIERQARG